MGKLPRRTGVGQLAFTFGDEPKHEASATEHQASAPAVVHANCLAASSDAPSMARMRPGRKQKWHSLIDKVYALPNLTAAWERVHANRGAAGVDGMSIAQFKKQATDRLAQLQEDLRSKQYRPKPVRRVYIPKAGGGKRPLGIPTVRDRIVQQALLQVLEPIYEGVFCKQSHGFRPGRGCATALDVVDRAIRHGYTWVVDADIRTFFDTVDHKLLISALNEEVADGRVLDLIGRILRAGVVMPETAELEPTTLGTPQGGPLSPLLANVYLHAFDLAIREAGYGLVRYADDFVIFTRSESEARAALTLAQTVLEGRLALRLHPEKTRIVSVDAGFEFLGFHYFRSSLPTRSVHCKEVRRKSAVRFRDAIRERTPRLHAQRRVKPRSLTLTRLSKNKRVKRLIERLNAYLRGWHWYFKSIQPQYRPDAPFDTFDYFVRARVRAAIVGRVGNGWWTVKLTNQLLRSLGLIPLAELNEKYREGTLAQPARSGILGGEPYAGKLHVRFG